MAFEATPTEWIPGWSEDGTDISVPIASFPELSVAEADGTDGDIRKIMFAICDKLWDVWNSTVEADRPGKMIITKSSSPNVSTGVTPHSYTFTFHNVITAQDVADED